MTYFTYWARDATGQPVTGGLEASDERSGAVSLSRMGYHVIRIQQRGFLEELVRSLSGGRERVDRQEVLILLRELAALLRSGIPLVTSLEGAIQQSQSPVLRRVLGDVTRRVQGGASFSEALAVHPEVFQELFISMIQVGEVAGILDQVLDRLARMGTREMEMRSKVQLALVYPLVLVGFAFLMVNGLLVGVLPKFISVFQSSRVVLPWPTRILLGVSNLMRHYGWLLGFFAAAGGWWAVRYYNTPGGRWKVDRALISLPVVGALYRKILVARVAHILGEMLRTGVPLLQALLVAEKTVPNVLFQKTLQKTRLAVAEGRGLAESWSTSGLFPPLVLQMVSVGERSGQLDAMLTEIDAFYDPEIEITIRKLTTLLEPILLLTMGLMVAFIALSVLLPIFQLIRVFRH